MPDAVRVTGYWGLKYQHSPLSETAFGWPFGTIEVRDRKLILDVHQPFAAPYHTLLRRSKYRLPVVVPVEAITSLRIQGDTIGVAWISSDDPTFRRLNFGALGRRFKIIIEALRQLGVPIE